MTLLGVILFAVALLVSIMLHEAGHMYFARRAGGKVTEFFVGFGPRLWSFRRGETEYGVKAIPAGGYVKIIGMTDLEPIDPADEDRAFYKKPLGQRLITLAAGSLVHFTIALILFAMVPMFWDDHKADTSTTVGTVQTCLSPTGAKCTAADDAAHPAPAAGKIMAGDRVVSVNGIAVSSWTDVVTQLHAGQPKPGPGVKGNPVKVVVDRGGQPVVLDPIVPQAGSSTQNLLVGISSGSVAVHYTPIQALGQGFTSWGSYFKGSVQGLVNIPASIPKLFKQTTTDAPRSDDTPVGVVGMAGISGDIIKANGYGQFLMFVAAINMFIGIFNLLPLLPLDGGHIAIALYEAARRKWAALRKRPDPGRVDLNKLMPVAFGFLVIFVGLSLLLIAADITNPLKFPS